MAGPRLVKPILLAAALAFVVLAGCRPITAEPGAVQTLPTASATAAPAAEAATMNLTESEQALVAAAAEQVAQKLEVAAGSLTLVSLEAVEWPDSSLGCPEPDMMYAQVITPGYKLVFDASGTPVEAHTDAQQPSQIVTCQP